ncbi:hypothetical protein [Halorubrum sp. F4]|uniref:hypothetical protein n=1 Tax=Halorubrum sp. F4 TaxID=2989715 RepID=UPI002480FAF2|nr:hypothetical protein [Halorubrum sp. F4]
MTRLTRTFVGETGFERAAAWSATGFALSLLAVHVLASAVSLDPTPVAAACMAVSVIGVASLARVGGGLLPGVLLSYGPTAGVLLGVLGPEIRLVAGGGIAIGSGTARAAATAIAVAEPLALAVAGAVAVGGVGYAVGRGLVVVGGR